MIVTPGQWPKIEPYVGEMPDQFAHRMAGEMIRLLHDEADKTTHRFKASFLRSPPPATFAKQNEWITRICRSKATTLLAVFLKPQVVNGSFSAQFILAIEPENDNLDQIDIWLWDMRRASTNTPVTRQVVGICTITKHAIARMLQRCTIRDEPIRDLNDLHVALRGLARAAMLDRVQRLWSKDKDPETFRIAWPGGRAILKPIPPPAFSRAAVVTILEPEQETDPCKSKNASLTPASAVRCVAAA